MGGGVPQVLVANNARYPTSTDGSTLIYTRLFQPGGAADFYRLEQLAPDGTTTTDLTMAWASYESIDSTDQAYIAPGGDQMVFVGRAADTNSVQVYLFSLSGEAIGSGGSPIARLTNDSADYSDPALSPDGRQVVAVRTWNEGDLIGPDLVTINVTNRIQTALTNDGGATIEAMPRFSPDGRTIVFAAGAPNTPRDLYLIATQGVTTAPLLQTDFDELLPVYSPDGGFIAFSSDRYGSYDVFVFDVSTRALLQLTFSAEDDYATLWLP
jgi:Tol biopolymer transport system component